jgi:hypothetical protein
MGKRVLYAGGLSHATSDHQLRDVFGVYGTVAHEPEVPIAGASFPT